jgi:hypothetical protein
VIGALGQMVSVRLAFFRGLLLLDFLRFLLLISLEL